MKPEKYVGRASEQVDAYLKNVLRPLLEKNKEILGVKAEINVYHPWNQSRQNGKIKGMLHLVAASFFF